ncbi:ATPase associated with various cellular activities AAA_3 [Nitratifractor salsuginis DSM 16511]|uniref:ATPase associated with various cellular activities AAA_3 n=2 Tax=Nitratifractor salsuginis TaxID=269261 RepID=E6WZG3_NITSE|nr:MoxR family ATPase [Nitratifractor salsuginis]ADV45543.1 ATPase associated with various cellular activities AAA_3 [Nitratifractor salsuginis DSM 16511]
METIQKIRNEIHKVVVGQEKMVEALLTGLLTRGHILLEGVPGLAKTTTVNALAKTLGLTFKRVQFTPDLLPSDIIGTEIYDPTNNTFKIKKGPVFTNLLLADEINRAPAKVQSALLEVMQERQVTIGDETFKIALPFLVMATQNPVEQEGAYELPEAQLDRFMMKVVVGYNTREEELEIARRVANNAFGEIQQVASIEDLDRLRQEAMRVHMDPEIERYIVELVFATREPEKYGLEKLKPYIEFGASPRASIDMYKAARAVAYLKGQEFVSPVEIAYIAKEVLRHRIILSYEAQAEEVSQDRIIEEVLSAVPIP